MLTRRIGRSLFGLAIAAALGFGGSELLAREQSCAFDPSTGQLGYCYAGPEDCNERCIRDVPGSPGGFCMDPGNCCICAY
jgi:hypothetical protein